MSTKLIVSIVGHTNAGKTSLIRTLLRNARFGDVRNQPGTTRHVESALIVIDTQDAIELRDTPGLEDSSALLEHLVQLEDKGTAHRQTLSQCIEQSAELPDFEQEIKVLKQTLESNLLLYVIDCREPVLAKFIDEIAILARAALPILPVLNFIHHPSSSVEQWRGALAQQGLHAYVNFDTVAYDFAAEKRLYEKFKTLLEPHYRVFEKLIAKREADWNNLKLTACQRVAHLLYDACALRFEVNAEQAREQASEQLQDSVRQLEQQALTDILELMQFERGDIELETLPVSDGRWQFDLFAPDTLKMLGLDTASAAATGAAIGAGLDLLFAGMSLGAATAAGATIGAVLHTGRRFGKSMMGRLQGREDIGADDATLDLLLLRQIWLLTTLFNRGHAAQNVSTYKPPKIAQLSNWSKLRNDLRASAANIGLSKPEATQQLQHSLLEQLAALS